jgi:oxygen-independent coproporphyrinogen-3 oxidase
LPHQTAASWELSLAETIATGVPHVSVYILEVDEDSRLGSELLAGGTRYHAHFVPDEDAIADFYLMACDRLNSAGIVQYEISNFARDGFESQHNLKYWTRQPYFGFGVDAHSMLLVDREGHGLSRAEKKPEEEPGFSPSNHGNQAVRFAPPDSLEQYMNAACVNRAGISRAEALEESFFLGLRLTRGVSIRELTTEFGEEAVDGARSAIADFVDGDLLEERGDRMRLTSQGRLLSNEVFERFIVSAEITG